MAVDQEPDTICSSVITGWRGRTARSAADRRVRPSAVRDSASNPAATWTISATASAKASTSRRIATGAGSRDTSRANGSTIAATSSRSSNEQVFTLTVYAHVTPTMQRGAVDRFTAALATASNGTD